jgi:hypothetical protein
MQPAARSHRSREPASSAPPVTSRSNREQAHCVLLARRLAGKSGASPEGRTNRPVIDQLNVPGSTMTGADDGDIMPPPSPHEPHAGPHAGSCIGVPQAGWQGWACGAAQGAAPPAHGERNSMNDGRRQLFAPPKQLLQPGAAARLPRAITRHRVRHMIGISTTAGPRKPCGRTRCVVRDDACQNPSSRSAARSDRRLPFSKKFRGRLLPFPPTLPMAYGRSECAGWPGPSAVRFGSGRRRKIRAIVENSR